MSDRLLDNFPPISKQEWLDKLQSDLKGKPYEKLVRLSESGIPIAPVYTADDLPDGVGQSYPGMDDLRRGDAPLMWAGKEGWRIGHLFAGNDLATLQAWTSAMSQDGGEPIWIQLAPEFRNALKDTSRPSLASSGLVLDNWRDLESIFEWSNASQHPVWLAAGDAGIDFLDSGYLGKFKGGLDLNPFRFFKVGDADESLMNEWMPLLANALTQLGTQSAFRLFTFDLDALEAAGANAAQQIAYALAMASDLAARLEPLGIAPAQTFAATSISFPITTDFFGEVAKLRAFRILRGRMLEAWGVDSHDFKLLTLQAQPAQSTETIADPHVNLLRHTTQAMAAVLGGCWMLTIPSYDAHFATPDSDGMRIASNIQHILKEESHFKQIVDPLGGAYFAEYLTDALAAKAWPIFQAIEADGGWYKSLLLDKLKPVLEVGLQRRKAAVRTGARAILGTNSFPNELENIAGAASSAASAAHHSAIYQRTRRLGQAMGMQNPSKEGHRLAQEFEALRLRMQALATQDAKIKHALLLTMGDPLMRAARATFSRNVLAAGGFTCTENASPNAMDASVAAAMALQPSVILLCGADADYLADGAAWLAAMHTALPQAILLLAGKPEGWEALQQNGLQEPIFAGMDRVALLDRLLQQLEIKQEARP